MSRRHNRKSNKKYVASDSKHSKTSSDRKSAHSTSSSSERVKKKCEGAEISKYNAKEPPLSQRFDDGAGCSKTKTHLDVKGPTKDFKEEASEGISSDTRKYGKISIHFKNKAKRLGGGRSHGDATVTFPGNEGSESNACSESGAKRQRKGLEDLKVLNSWKKNKKKATVEHSKLQEIIVKRMLEQFEETILPTLCSSQLRKKPSSLSFCRQQKTSKKPYPPSSGFSSQKLFVQECGEAYLQTASPKLPSKSGKEMKHVPLPELHTCWKYHKQKERQGNDPAHNICNSRTHRKKREEAALHVNQNTCGLPGVSCLAKPTESTNTDQEMQIIEDLHAVRVDKKIALPVVEACGELTSMEIDGDEEANKSFRTLSDWNTLIVIDTNIMISHLEFIRSLKNTNIPGIGKFGLIIPWVVLQELDNLKKGRILANVAQKAIPAVHFIHTCLKNQDSKLWGQSVQLASQQIDGFRVENNDDRVLQCCLLYQKLFPQIEVVLLTDDKNLCNKALVSEVKALCKTELDTALRKMDLINAASTTWQQSENESKNLQEKSTDPFSRVISDLEKSLGEVLSSILQTEMKIAYGDLWTEVVYRSPPWTLADLLECYKKHWIAVFGQIIPRSFLSTIEYLSTQLCKAGKASHATTEQVLRETKMLLDTFSSRSDYDGALPQALTSVNKLSDTLKKIQSGTGLNSSDVACEKMEDVTLVQHTEAGAKSLLTDSTSQGNRHPEIWSVLESAWNTMNLYRHEVFQKLDLSAIDTIQYRSSFKEAFLGLQKLMAAVNEILAGIQQVLMPNSSFQDVWTLYNFLTKNKISSSITFTAEEFYDCVSQGMYRERLSIGCSQLVQLEHAIKECYESVGLEAKNRGWF